jgi:hypothetical protein
LSLLLWLGLVLAASEQETCNHVPQEVLVAQSNHVQVGLPESLGVCEERSEKAIAALCGEAENKHPMKEPLSLVKHLHRELIKAGLDDVLELADGDLLDAFTALLILNLAC